MTVKAIVAVERNYGIGRENSIPWRLPEDLAHFKKITIGDGNNAVLCGRKTYESIGKFLNDRDNYVLGNGILKFVDDDVDIHLDKKYLVQEIMTAIYQLSENYDDLWIIGGQSIYELFWDQIEEIYLTYIDADFDCDRFFPIDKLQNKWYCLNMKDKPAEIGYELSKAKNGLHYGFYKLIKI